MIIKTYAKYIIMEYVATILKISFIFYTLIFILNIFEEMNFFKDYEVSIKFPIMLSALFVPNLLYKMFPFIMLL